MMNSNDMVDIRREIMDEFNISGKWVDIKFDRNSEKVIVDIHEYVLNEMGEKEVESNVEDIVEEYADFGFEVRPLL